MYGDFDLIEENMKDQPRELPDNTAARTALWRALHVQEDAVPHILVDEVGLRLVAPEDGWQERPDMKYTKRLRASIVGRSRFVEDLAKEQFEQGAKQYVLLGAGLDSFAQRNTALLSDIDLYEIDQAETLTWKKKRLIENGYEISANFHFVPVNFEESSWWDTLLDKGFDIHKKTFVSCTGVTLYLSKEAIMDTLQKMTLLMPQSSIAIAFYLPLEQLEEEDQGMQEMAIKGAEAAGTPFVSFFSVEEVKQLAEEIGLNDVRIISTGDIRNAYFKGRSDGLNPASGEIFLVAKV